MLVFVSYWILPPGCGTVRMGKYGARAPREDITVAGHRIFSGSR